MAAPSGTTLTPYTQAYSSDALDRLSSGPAGTYSYTDANQVHAVTGLSTIPNQYAAYDAMGNMTCRNTDTSTAHTCAGSSPTGAVMNYDSRGQLATWSAPSGTHYLYDNEGNRVLTSSSAASSTTDTVYFDGYTETVLSGGTTTTTKYYSANGTRIAVRIGGATLDYLLSDPLGSTSVALNNTGQVIGLEHYSPYGIVDYSWGSMPTSFNYAGERLDSQTGLLYDNFRWYDPLLGQFTRADTKQNNTQGMNPYAYVGGNPETRTDPTGHMYLLPTVPGETPLDPEVFAADAQALHNGTAPTLAKSGLPPILYLYLYHNHAYTLMRDYFPGVQNELSLEAAAVTQYIDGISPKDQNARQEYAGTLEQQRLGALISQAGGGGDTGHAGEPGSGSGSLAEGTGDQVANTAGAFFNTGSNGGRQFVQVSDAVIKKDLDMDNPQSSAYNFYLDSEGNIFLVKKGVSITSEASLNQAATNGQVMYAGDVYSSKPDVLS
jgi:RHS repeat-associated protein